MDVQVSPVVRGEFVYRDILLVDVGGEGNRHARASEAELKDLLNGKAPKDQTAKFYEAQLIHYGLQRSKEKNTAKVRLQQALSQGKLKGAPSHLTDMESQMKKDYASAVRKAKSQSKAASKSILDAPASKAQKRKNEEVEQESAKRSKISMKIGDISINIDHSSTDSQEKKTQKKDSKAVPKQSSQANKKEKSDPSQQRATPSTRTTKPKATKGEDSVVSPPAKATKLKSKSVDPPNENSQPPLKKAAKPKVEPQTPSTTKVKAEAKKPSKFTKETESRPSVKSESKVKKEPAVKRNSPIKKEINVKHEDGDEYDVMMQDQNDLEPRQRNVTGIYDLFCPQLEDEFPDCSDDLRMYLAVDEGKIWGGFQLLMKSGVVKVDSISTDDEMSFGWRARDSEDGQPSFGRNCFGNLELFGHEQIRGTFYNLLGHIGTEPLFFEGKRRPGALWSGRSSYSYQKEWNGFVTEAYGR